MRKLLSFILAVTLLFTVFVGDFSYAKEADLTTLENGEWYYSDEGIDITKKDGSENEMYNWTLGNIDDNVVLKQAMGPFGAKRGEAYDVHGLKSNTTLKHYYDTDVFPEDDNTIPSYFFLKKVNLTNIQNKDLKFFVKYDDSYTLYINGVEVHAENTEEYTSNLQFAAADTTGDPVQREVVVPATNLKNALKEGENIFAVRLNQRGGGSSDIYFDLRNIELVEPKVDNGIYYPMLTIGKDQTERNFTFYTAIPGEAKVEITTADDAEFTKAKTLEASNKYADTNTLKYQSHQFNFPNLAENTEYIYRVSVGNISIDEVYSFKTGSFGKYSFSLVGDPQIGSGGSLNGSEGWGNTLDLIRKTYPNTSFLLSAGDQVNTASNEDEYTHFIEKDGFKGLTLAPVIGNHDSGNRAYSEHFYLPKNADGKGATTAGENYYYVYNNTLFISLNSNNRSASEHKETIEKAIAETKDKNIKWKVVTFHHAIYTVASHAYDGDILQRREQLAPIFKELGIDVVLNGHDHVYVRSHLMDGTQVIEEYNEDGSVPTEYQDPKGILYMTVTSGSGSKFYNIKNEKFDYSAVQNQERIPNYTQVDVTDYSFKLSTYRTTDNSLVDEVTLYKGERTQEIKVEQTAGGTIAPETGNVETGSNQTYTITPNKGYKIKDVLVDGKSVGPVNSYTFENIQAPHSIKAVFEKEAPPAFDDDNPGKKPGKRPVVDDKNEEKSFIKDMDGHWAKDPVEKIVTLGYMDLSDGYFFPEISSDRLTVVRALARYQKVDWKDYAGKSLNDIKVDSEESGYINWAIENGIIKGYEDGSFKADRHITREEMAAILNRFVEKFDKKLPIKENIDYVDSSEISDWAKEEVEMATKRGLFVGRDDNHFAPKSHIKRGEVAKILISLMSK